MIALLFLDNVFSTLNELDFVVRVLMFSYLLFWCYMTFRDAQLLSALSSIILGYMIFLHGLSVVLLLGFFMVFILFGNHLQMLFLFGIMPLFGYHNFGDRYRNMPKEQELMTSASRKVELGEQLSPAETQVVQQLAGEQEQAQAHQQMSQMDMARFRRM
ncbi:MAG: hypothetical protein WC607_00995 [Candidatus Micrarchaeia archaeon]